MIGAVCGADKVVDAIAVGIDAVHEHGRYTFASPGKILFGEGRQRIDRQRIDRLQEALTRAGIPNEVPADMLRAMWWKFMINVGINQASAVLRAPYRVFQSFSDARALMALLMQEVIAVAQTLGIDLSNKELDDWVGILATLAPDGKTSMLQDVEAGRKTEVEIFAGKMVALGNENNVPTPVNKAVLHMIKVIEQLKS
jgi:2-dehydropantoate 2-reductase